MTACGRRPQALEDLVTKSRRYAAGPPAVVIGDARDPDTVHRAIAGVAAVIAAIGPPGRHGPHHTAAVAKVIMDAMTVLSVPRLVITSAYPIVAIRPRLPLDRTVA
ncbi:NAD(P)H-binding protein [Nonomuraea sp. NPDC049028]|uniref:NAD(P)H-binding protein n=1 Tax=Nonomuraea sp. NPDC049028 TaxID=3364348 RepID=UPI003717A84F